MGASPFPLFVCPFSLGQKAGRMYGRDGDHGRRRRSEKKGNQEEEEEKTDDTLRKARKKSVIRKSPSGQEGKKLGVNRGGL